MTMVIHALHVVITISIVIVLRNTIQNPIYDFLNLNHKMFKFRNCIIPGNNTNNNRMKQKPKQQYQQLQQQHTMNLTDDTALAVESL